MKHLILLVINGVSERWRRCRLGLCACLLVGLLVMGCTKQEIIYRPTQQSVSTYSYLEAKNTTTQLWHKKYAVRNNFSKNPQKPGIKFKRDSIELTATDEKDGCVSTWKWVYMPNVDPYVEQYIPPLPPVMVIISARINKGGSSQIGCSPPYHSDGSIYFDTVSDAADFVNAYYVLKRDAGAAERAAEATFAASAKRYREMSVKPALRDDVRRFRVLAEDAFNNKEFGKAADYYEQGLEIEPLWPQGQYNAALLYGEMKDYGNAVLHMRRYLELVPDASDAQAARDQIVIWQSKIKQ